jgi:hypothetical protein
MREWPTDAEWKARFADSRIDFDRNPSFAAAQVWAAANIRRLQESAKEFDRAVQNAPSRDETFATELCAAVQRRLAPRSPSRLHSNMMTTTTAKAATIATSDESFATQLCKAVQRQLGSRSRQHNASAARFADENFRAQTANASEESFADELTKAVKQKIAAQRRKPTKG